MSKRHFVFLACAVLFLASQASGQDFPVFLSKPFTQEIVKVQTATATIFHDFTGTSFDPVTPEDMVVGPDGRLYVCDSFGFRIFRINIDPGGSAGDVVIIADLTGVATGPEGPSFLGDDLFFNTRAGNHTGVWKIPGVAAFDSAPFPPPVNLIPSISVGAIPFGEGTAFDPKGQFIIVDRAGDRILRASAPFTSFSVIIENPPSGPPIFDIARGVAVNGAGEIFVSNAFLFNIVRCVESAGTFTCSEFVKFDTVGEFGAFPAFMEFDAAGNLLVVTTDLSVLPSGDARLWEVDSDGVETQLVAFETFSEVVGLALPATEVSKVAEFRDDQKTNTYDFDSHKFILSLDVIVDKVFSVKITAKDVLPKNLKPRLDSAIFPEPSDCVRFAGKGGKCVVYLAEGNPSDLPIPGIDFTGDIEILIKYFDSPDSPAADPRMAHDSNEEPGDTFTDDITFEFFPSPNPDTDPALSGRTTRWSEFVAVDLGLSVQIDIKPGSFPNSIKLSGNGAIPVAILSTPSFDATTVDPSTVVLNSASVRLRGKGFQAHVEDVNGDGLLDLVVQVDRGGFVNLGIGIAVLTGVTDSGLSVSGTDSVRIIE